ncbi:hypothetical protein GFS60_07361 (plasmid) [Rhodococcus sp. WAY2]|nr:hypothetical protein GFS60_07361 [Rhodococcus sp. WAY2]
MISAHRLYLSIVAILDALREASLSTVTETRDFPQRGVPLMWRTTAARRTSFSRRISRSDRRIESSTHSTRALDGSSHPCVERWLHRPVNALAWAPGRR